MTHDQDDILENDVSQHFDTSVDALDKPFSVEEILIALNSLKSNKAHGDDKVLNEYIISTKDLFSPVYLNLFNYILKSGYLP